jgi:hypothetical protein
MALERLRALRPAAMVPGHGPVMRDDGYLDLMIRMLTSLTRQVDSAVARGETVEQAQKSVNLDEYRAAFAGDSKVRQGLFTNYVLLPGVACAHREASARRS